MHPDVNQKYIFTDLNYLQNISKRQNDISAIEINLFDENDMEAVQIKLTADLDFFN